MSIFELGQFSFLLGNFYVFFEDPYSVAHLLYVSCLDIPDFSHFYESEILCESEVGCIYCVC
jgi:hypothetical protein